MHPRLSKSYKGRFPFKLGTTSYIYPRGYVRNIELLAPWLDEIELLIFESRQAAWPSTTELEQMTELAEIFALRYHIHLPLDLPLGHAVAHIRCAAVDTVLRLCELTATLSPVSLTLHLPLDEDPADLSRIAHWQHRTLDSLQQLRASGVAPHTVSLENLAYPIEWINNLSEQTGFRMCLDVGHLIVQGVDVPSVFDRLRTKIDVIHLHGVRDGKDHLSLTEMADKDSHWIPAMLAQFTGSLSLEVFSYDRLVTSLDFFEKLWEKRRDAIRHDAS